MPQPHSTQNYTILKGVFSIAEHDANGVPGAYFDMGNVVTAEVEPVVERLPHYSNRSGYRVKDANPIISTEYMLRMTLDEHAAVNLAKYFMGTLAGGGDTIYALQAMNTEYAVRFVEDNPHGPNKTWDLWKLTLSPAGPLQLVGDGTEWAVMELQGEGLADTANHPESPYITVDYQAGETSTTTSTTSSTTTTTP
jgi:hypothetical protein